MGGWILFVRENIYCSSAVDLLQSWSEGQPVIGVVCTLDGLEYLCCRHDPEALVFLSVPTECELGSRIALIRDRTSAMRLIGVHNRSYSQQDNERLARIVDTFLSDEADVGALASALLNRAEACQAEAQSGTGHGPRRSMKAEMERL